MAISRRLTRLDLELDINLSSVTKDTIAEALEAGKNVVLIQSTFSDPGNDYNEIHIDGECVARIEGY